MFHRQGFEIVTGFDRPTAQWVSEKCGMGRFDNISCITVFKGGNMAGGVVLFNIGNGQCMGAWAFDDPRIAAKRDLWRLCHKMAVDLGIYRVNTMASVENTRTHRLAEFLGFRLEGRLKKGWDRNTDAVVYGILTDEWRFQDGTV